MGQGATNGKIGSMKCITLGVKEQSDFEEDRILLAVERCYLEFVFIILLEFVCALHFLLVNKFVKNRISFFFTVLNNNCIFQIV